MISSAFRLAVKRDPPVGQGDIHEDRQSGQGTSFGKGAGAREHPIRCSRQGARLHSSGREGSSARGARRQRQRRNRATRARRARRRRTDQKWCLRSIRGIVDWHKPLQIEQMETKGIEPSFRRCDRRVLPLHHVPEITAVLYRLSTRSQRLFNCFWEKHLERIRIAISRNRQCVRVARGGAPWVCRRDIPPPEAR